MKKSEAPSNKPELRRSTANLNLKCQAIEQEDILARLKDIEDRMHRLQECLENIEEYLEGQDSMDDSTDEELD